MKGYRCSLVICLIIMAFMSLACDKTHKNSSTEKQIEKLDGLDVGFYIKEGQDPDNGSKVSDEQVTEILKNLLPYTDAIRTFGSTQGLENAAKIAYSLDYEVYAGAWLGSDLNANEKEMENLIASAKAGYVDVAIVGSEVISRGDLSEQQLLSYIEQFKQEVPDIPVTTGEVYDTLIKHPAIIDSCDLVFANFYPYWKGIDIKDAIAALNGWYKLLYDVSDGKDVVVSETGWPSSGKTIGNAVPSLENANFYFKNFVSWAKAKKVKYFYFEAYDEPWKAKYDDNGWGLFTSSEIMKSGMESIFYGDTMADNWTRKIPGGEGTPEISLTYVPPVGSFNNLKGQVLHVDPYNYNIVVYIYVAGTWWLKPYWNAPLTTISPDGSWICDITTGGIDEKARSIEAYLIPAFYGSNINKAVATIKVNR